MFYKGNSANAVVRVEAWRSVPLRCCRRRWAWSEKGGRADGRADCRAGSKPQAAESVHHGRWGQSGVGVGGGLGV